MIQVSTHIASSLAVAKKAALYSVSAWRRSHGPGATNLQEEDAVPAIMASSAAAMPVPRSL